MGNEISMERQILQMYILQGISTNNLESQYNYKMSDIERIFIKYNINYPDRNNGKKGGGRGFHLGKYKKGYKNNMKRICPVTADDINDYMNCYLNKRCKTLEEYLSMKYDERSQPKPVPQPKPQPKPAPQPAPQTIHYLPDPTEYIDIPDDFSYSSPTSTAPAYGSSGGGLILIVVVGIIAVMLYKLVLVPVFDGIGNIFEKDSTSTSQSQTYVAPGQECELEMDVSFYGEKYQMLFNYKYIFHFDDQEVEVKVGQLNTLSCTTFKGKHKVWVQAGKNKSKVYTVDLTDDEAFIEFDLNIGAFAPKLKLTDIEGGEKD